MDKGFQEETFKASELRILLKFYLTEYGLIRVAIIGIAIKYFDFISKSLSNLSLSYNSTKLKSVRAMATSDFHDIK
jgi:hypothetical protein